VVRVRTLGGSEPGGSGGSPISGATVTITKGGVVTTGTTDGDGEYSYDLAQQSGNLTVKVEYEGCVYGPVTQFVSCEGHELDLYWCKGSVTVTVLGAGGGPLKDATVGIGLGTANVLPVTLTPANPPWITGADGKVKLSVCYLDTYPNAWPPPFGQRIVPGYASVKAYHCDYLYSPDADAGACDGGPWDCGDDLEFTLTLLKAVDPAGVMVPQNVGAYATFDGICRYSPFPYARSNGLLDQCMPECLNRNYNIEVGPCGPGNTCPSPDDYRAWGYIPRTLSVTFTRVNPTAPDVLGSDDGQPIEVLWDGVLPWDPLTGGAGPYGLGVVRYTTGCRGGNGAVSCANSYNTATYQSTSVEVLCGLGPVGDTVRATYSAYQLPGCRTYDAVPGPCSRLGFGAPPGLPYRYPVAGVGLGGGPLCGNNNPVFLTLGSLGNGYVGTLTE
jgi:hypothetical protein